jgi:type VI secretion system protein ImpK
MMSENSLVEYTLPIVFLLDDISNHDMIDSQEYCGFLRKKLLYYLQSFYEKVYAKIPVEALAYDAQFALIAYIDERISHSTSHIKDKWVSNLLQMELCGCLTAGEGFYERAEALLQKGKLADPILEIYYFCLALGFRGQYFDLETNKVSLLAEHIRMRSTVNQKITFPGLHEKRHKLFFINEFSVISRFLMASCVVILFVSLTFSLNFLYQQKKLISYLSWLENYLIELEKSA